MPRRQSALFLSLICFGLLIQTSCIEVPTAPYIPTRDENPRERAYVFVLHQSGNAGETDLQVYLFLGCREQYPVPWKCDPIWGQKLRTYRYALTVIPPNQMVSLFAKTAIGGHVADMTRSSGFSATCRQGETLFVLADGPNMIHRILPPELTECLIDDVRVNRSISGEYLNATTVSGLKNRAEITGGNSAGKANITTLADKLKTLIGLRDQGLITTEEYTTRRQELLDKEFKDGTSVVAEAPAEVTAPNPEGGDAIVGGAGLDEAIVDLVKDNPTTLIGTKSTDYRIYGFRLGLTHNQAWQILRKTPSLLGETDSGNPTRVYVYSRNADGTKGNPLFYLIWEPDEARLSRIAVFQDCRTFLSASFRRLLTSEALDSNSEFKKAFIGYANRSATTLDVPSIGLKHITYFYDDIGLEVTDQHSKRGNGVVFAIVSRRP